jgi:Ca2+-binding RTX toxin-like protein
LHVAAALGCLAVLASPARASAFVTARIEQDNSGRTRLSAVSNGGSDIVKVSCGADLNVKVNGLDPLTGPFACNAIQRVQVLGYSGNDTINVTRVGPRNGFSHPSLRHRYSFRAFGQGGADRITGSRLRDELSGGRGNDALRGRGRADLLRGGPGHDLLNGGRGRDVLRGGPGDDTLRR